MPKTTGKNGHNSKVSAVYAHFTARLTVMPASYSVILEQNKFGFVQFDKPKIENHLLTPESYELKKDLHANYTLQIPDALLFL